MKTRIVCLVLVSLVALPAFAELGSAPEPGVPAPVGKTSPTSAPEEGVCRPAPGAAGLPALPWTPASTYPSCSSIDGTACSEPGTWIACEWGIRDYGLCECEASYTWKCYH